VTILPSKMKAARFYEVNEPLRVEEVPVPEVQEDEVLVQTRAVGLCGSDIHIVFEGVTPTAFTPITLGHEPSGEVAHTGTRVKGWEEGDRVTVDPVLFCGSCRNCITGHTEICLTRRLIGIQAEGALAEYVVVPAKNLVRLPENVPFTVGAIITDAIATPFHALVDRAVLKVGESVAIYGVGGLGLHALQIARLLGAAKIFVVDPREEQLERAKRLGGDVTINPEENSPVEAILEATGGLGVDVAVELVGLEQTVAQAVESLARGGSSRFGAGRDKNRPPHGLCAGPDFASRLLRFHETQRRTAGGLGCRRATGPGGFDYPHLPSRRS
jgi:propanol-preferring alcohol dehydrogenase